MDFTRDDGLPPARGEYPTSIFFRELDAVRENKLRWDQVPTDVRNAMVRNDPRDPVDWLIHRRPDQIYSLEASTVVRVCGRGVGKSLGCSHYTNRLFSHSNYRRGLFIAPTDGMVRDTNVLGDDGLVACSRYLTSDNFKTERGGRHTLNYPNGSKLYVGSAASPNSSRGRTTEFGNWDEMGYYEKIDEFFAAVIPTRRPRVGGVEPRLTITTTGNMNNPRANQYLMELRDRYENGDKSIDFQQVPSEVNRAISPQTHRENRRDFLGSQLLETQEFDAALILDEGKTILFKHWMFERGTHDPAKEFDIHYTMGFVDPAFTKSRTADQSGIAIGAMTRDGEVVLLHTERDHYSPKELDERMRYLHSIYNPDAWRGERNGLGEFFNAGVSVPNFATVHADHDPRRRATSILGVFEGLRVILFGGETKHRQFIEDACGFAGDDKYNLCEYDDNISAAVHLVRELFAAPVYDLHEAPVMLGATE